MRNRSRILPVLLTVLMLFIPAGRSGAVFNEKDLARTLQVLRYELGKAYAEMERSRAGFEVQQQKQHKDLIKLVKSCDELSLMLYSQKQDYTFDLTYALQQVTDQYRDFSETRMPFDNIISYFDVEIDRYERLLKTLRILPPELMEVPDSLGPSLLGALAMTLHIAPISDVPYVDETGAIQALASFDPEEISAIDFQLDSISQIDRDTCIFYASEMLSMFTAARENLVEDSNYYENTDKRLREAYNYAQERYKMVRKRIFVSGLRNYWFVITHMRQSLSRAVSDCHDKYSRDYFNHHIQSEWRGPIVVLFSFAIIFYLVLAALISWLVMKVLKKKVKAFKSEGFASREFAFLLLASLLVFVILLLGAKLLPGVGSNFFKMASSLLFEYAVLLVAILGSLLIRCGVSQIRGALKVYLPVMLFGLVIIAFRIVFIPNSLINLIFPPLLTVFGFWQLVSYRKNYSVLPKIDRALAATSLVVTAVTLFLSLVGYVLMGLQVYIWWIFQLTVLEVIAALKDLLGRYKTARVDKLVRAYRMKHPSEVGNDKGAFILVTWLYDFLDMVVIPLLVLLSIPFCLLRASTVFDLTEIFRGAMAYTFLDTKAIRLSMYKLLTLTGLFFIFRYLEYLARSLYRVYKMRSTISKSDTGLVRENEVNLTLSRNVIGLLVWGFYIILAVSILKIPTDSLKVIAAGLAAGLGFAMKDILNNFFYGIQLMSGRLRVGDTLECDGIRGTVESISYQTTTIRAIDGSLIAFPNGTLFSKTFKNLTRSDSYEYIALPVGVAYGTDVDKARRVLLKALKPLCKPDKFGRDTVKPSYGIQVTMTGFGDSSVNLVVKQYVLVEQRYAYVAKANEIIYKALGDNGIEIPFPQRDIYIKQVPEGNKSE